jgi:hypothetical protein
MTDSLILVNVGSVIASFRIFRPITCDTNLPRHKLRKVVRNANVDVQILPGQTKDLVPLTELSSATLLTLPEVQSIMRSPHIQLLSDLEAPPVVVSPSVIVSGVSDVGQKALDLNTDEVVRKAEEPVAFAPAPEVPAVSEEPSVPELIKQAIATVTPVDSSIALPSLPLDDEDSSMSKKKKNDKRLFK